MNAQGVITLSTPIKKSARVLQASGMFDIPQETVSTVEVPYSLPLDEKPWNVGMVVGPSGSGKSSIARHVWPDSMAWANMLAAWGDDTAVVDGFPYKMPIKDILEMCSSVGFSSPPAWLRPFRVLSTGEQFRVNIARMLAVCLAGNPAIMPWPIVVDEFTSVVDRTVAQIGSSAVARTVRKYNQQFVAVTCHYDVEEWLQPDWVFRTDDSTFRWRSVQPRPSIELSVRRVHHSLWQTFYRHHYLSADLNKAAVCFAAFYKGRPVAFDAWLSQPHRSIPNMRRSTRLVTLPDFQGIGIGNRLNETCASMWRTLGFRPMITTSHPAVVGHCTRSPLWVMNRGASRNTGGGMMTRDVMGSTIANDRYTAGFEYVGPMMDKAQAETLHGGEQH